MRQRGREQPGTVAGHQVGKVAQRVSVEIRAGCLCGNGCLGGAQDSVCARLLDVAGQLALEVDVVFQVGGPNDADVKLSARCVGQ